MVLKFQVSDHDQTKNVPIVSDWAHSVNARCSCSGSLQIGGTTVHPWSDLQSIVALSSREAEQNSAFLRPQGSGSFGMDRVASGRQRLARERSSKIRSSQALAQPATSGASCQRGIWSSRYYAPRALISVGSLTHPGACEHVDRAVERMSF